MASSALEIYSHAELEHIDNITSKFLCEFRYDKEKGFDEGEYYTLAKICSSPNLYNICDEYGNNKTIESIDEIYDAMKNLK